MLWLTAARLRRPICWPGAPANRGRVGAGGWPKLWGWPSRGPSHRWRRGCGWAWSGRGYLGPAVQYVIADDYGFPLARVDLAYPVAKLAIEYDGAHHFDARRARLDRQRDAELAVPRTVHRVGGLLGLPLAELT